MRTYFVNRQLNTKTEWFKADFTGEIERLAADVSHSNLTFTTNKRETRIIKDYAFTVLIR